MNNLKKYRIWKGLLQVDVAYRIGVTTNTYANYENNKSELPKKYYKEIEELYGINIQQIYKRGDK